ncbi:anaerobic ribonucleoside-triphosphate reductase activating protein [Mannheimia granulomatis]|uniref:Anaerobic ribonucleoside-triphosphate reductase activating protein n=1 Tax=Mannheimia granulomatis TaxID=85402 RepID=A0A011P7P4_9PAST|nr:anaerobic ribonucleoside-triphosphate reductase activating protein [Mannheimia granulomatis]EXI62444.1 anaerobic ribonucleoside-triphosphate reductase activating protein [Mannheimia granulomatis]QLB15354.1 anaerobic ribonucleoside-triphosphate reductase activating protein [Mannheimia granulomatis]QLB18369.1 anaerobic ribonucleoside-triphosphate reductase activating protein [Mannheimia granulomatis]RGE47497.1 anaerobic ribonucleoside-triphosphate reductase activating protein [Mannheimia granu
MENLRFNSEQIVWQEVPNETSLAFLITGCPLGCKGCHSADSWKACNGTVLTPEYLSHRLTRYQGLISCVLFMGGEWKAEKLTPLLKLAKQQGLKTCLYTGLEKDQLPECLLAELTYLKTGRWIAERGGLESLTTNQRFIDLRSNQNLNHLFIKGDLI